MPLTSVLGYKAQLYLLFPPRPLLTGNALKRSMHSVVRVHAGTESSLVLPRAVGMALSPLACATEQGSDDASLIWRVQICLTKDMLGDCDLGHQSLGLVVEMG